MKKRPKTQSSVPPMHVILSHRRTHSHDENNSIGYLSDGPLDDNERRPRSKSVMTLDRKPNEGPRYHGKFAKVKMSKSPKSSPVLRHRTKSTVSAPDSSLLTDKRLSRSFESLVIFDDPSSGENNDIKEVEEIIKPVQGKPPKGERRGTLQRLFTKAKSSFDLFVKAEKAEKAERPTNDIIANATQGSQKTGDDEDDDYDDIPWKPRPRTTSEPLKSGEMLFSLVAFDDVTKSLDDLSSDRRNVEETQQPDSSINREMSNSGSVFLSPHNNEESSPQSSETQPNVTKSQDDINEHSQTAEIMVLNAETHLPDDLETSSDDGTIPETQEQADDNYELIFEMEMDKTLDEMQLDIQNTPTQDLTEDTINTVADKQGDEFSTGMFSDLVNNKGSEPARIKDKADIHIVESMALNTLIIGQTNTSDNDRDSSDELIGIKTGDNTSDVAETSAVINESSPVDEGTAVSKSQSTDSVSKVNVLCKNTDEGIQSQVKYSDESTPKDDVMGTTEIQVSQLVTSIQSPDIKNQDENINEAPTTEKGTNTIDDTTVNNAQSGTQISSLLNVELQQLEDRTDTTLLYNVEDRLQNGFRSAGDLGDLTTQTGDVNEVSSEEPTEWHCGRGLTIEYDKECQSKLIDKEEIQVKLCEVQTKEVKSIEENSGVDLATVNENSEDNKVDEFSRKFFPEQIANLHELSVDIPNLNFDTIPDSTQIILKTVDVNQVSVSKTEPIEEMVNVIDSINHSVFALELISDTALGFPECCSAIPRCTCDTVTYHKRSVFITMDEPKQDSQIVLIGTSNMDKHPETEDETYAPGTDAVKHSNDLSNKIKSSLEVEEENKNTKESNDNENNHQVNTEFTTKWKIYVYHTTMVLETISGPVSHTAPDATNRAEEEDKKFATISDAQAIRSINMAENNDIMHAEVFETLNSIPDPRHRNEEECYQDRDDLPIPVIRIESPTTAESSFSGAESSDRSSQDSSKEITHSQNQEDLVTPEQHDESRETGTPEDLNLGDKDSVECEENSTAEETSDTEKTDNRFNSHTEPTTKEIEEKRIPPGETSVHKTDDIQKPRQDGLCPTETTNMLSEILNELEPACHNDEDQDDEETPKVKVKAENDIKVSEAISKQTNRIPSLSRFSCTENEDQGFETRQLDEENYISKLDITSGETICNQQEIDEGNRFRLPSTDVPEESMTKNDAERCRTLSQNKNISAIQDSESCSDDGSIPHPDKEEALETCRGVKIRNLISLFESGTARQSRTSTLPRSGVNLPISKTRTVSTLPRKTRDVPIRKAVAGKVSKPLQSENIWASMPNLAQRSGTNGTDDSQDRQDSKRAMGAREEIQTLQKKKFVSSVILKFQQLEKQSLGEQWRGGSQPIKNRNGALKHAQLVGRAKSTSNLASEEVSIPALHQTKPHCVSTGNLLHQQPLSYSQDESIDLNVFEFDDAQDTENSLRKCKSEVFFTDSHESDSSRASGMESARNASRLNLRHGFRKLSLRSDSSDLSDGYLAEAEDSDVSPAHMTNHFPSSFTREV